MGDGFDRLAVSIAGNVGHIQPTPDQTVGLADRLTAASSPLAAFAGLAIGLLVLKMTLKAGVAPTAVDPIHAVPLAEHDHDSDAVLRVMADDADASDGPSPGGLQNPIGDCAVGPDPGLVRAAFVIYRDAAAHGQRLSQRALARQLRGHGHRFPNAYLRSIADSIGLTADITSTAAEFALRVNSLRERDFERAWNYF